MKNRRTVKITVGTLLVGVLLTATHDAAAVVQKHLTPIDLDQKVIRESHTHDGGDISLQHMVADMRHLRHVQSDNAKISRMTGRENWDVYVM
jgi:hypothetical protein